MKNKFFIPGWIILFIVFFAACLRDDLDLPADRATAYTNFGIRDARSFFEENATELEPLTFNKAEVTSKCASTLPSVALTSEWDNALVETNDMVQMIGVPLQSGTVPYALRSEVSAAGKTSSLKLLTFRRLVVAKLKTGQVQMYVMTLIPDYGDMGKLVKDPMSFRYLGGSDFSGLVFFSGLNGHFIEGYRYDNGKNTSPVYVRPRQAVTEEGERRYNETRFRLSFGESAKTRSGTYGASSEPDHSSCPQCHGQSRECFGECPLCETSSGGNLGEVVVSYCSHCQNPTEECKCCPACNFYPCRCCPWCFSYPCRCSCIWCNSNPCKCCPVCRSYPCQCPKCQYCGRKFCYGTCQSVTPGGVTPDPDKEPNCPDCHKSPCVCPRCPYCLKTKCNTVHDDCDNTSQTNRRRVGNNYNLLSSKGAVQFQQSSHPSFQDFLNAVARDTTVEHSTSLVYWPEQDDPEKQYYLKNIKHGDNMNVSFNGASSNVIADIHSHPSGQEMIPSPQDIMMAASGAKENSFFEYLYVHAGGDIYALYIEDRAKAAAFYNANFGSVGKDNNFIPGTKLYTEWTNAMIRYNSLKGIQKKEYTIADILNKNNTGIKFLKKESGDNSFKAINVKKNDYTGYTSPVVCK